MSHCCGGCGGEDPLKKNEKTAEVDGKKSSKDTEKSIDSTAATGTWQPPKK